MCCCLGGGLVVDFRIGGLMIGFGAAFVGLMCDCFGWVLNLFVLWFKACVVVVILMLLVWCCVVVACSLGCLVCVDCVLLGFLCCDLVAANSVV